MGAAKVEGVVLEEAAKGAVVEAIGVEERVEGESAAEERGAGESGVEEVVSEGVVESGVAEVVMVLAAEGMVAEVMGVLSAVGKVVAVAAGMVAAMEVVVRTEEVATARHKTVLHNCKSHSKGHNCEFRSYIEHAYGQI